MLDELHNPAERCYELHYPRERYVSYTTWLNVFISYFTQLDAVVRVTLPDWMLLHKLHYLSERCCSVILPDWMLLYELHYLIERCCTRYSVTLPDWMLSHKTLLFSVCWHQFYKNVTTAPYFQYSCFHRDLFVLICWQCWVMKCRDAATTNRGWHQKGAAHINLEEVKNVGRWLTNSMAGIRWDLLEVQCRDIWKCVGFNSISA